MVEFFPAFQIILMRFSNTPVIRIGIFMEYKTFVSFMHQISRILKLRKHSVLILKKCHDPWSQTRKNRTPNKMKWVRSMTK